MFFSLSIDSHSSPLSLLGLDVGLMRREEGLTAGRRCMMIQQG